MRKADNLPPSCAVVTKSGKLNLLESSGPLQACNGTDLPLPLHLKYPNNTRFEFLMKMPVFLDVMPCRLTNNVTDKSVGSVGNVC